MTGVLAFVSRNRLALLAVSTAALALGLCAGAASGGRDAAHALSFQQVASGFASPVDVASAPGDPSTLYVVEQQGTIKIVKGGQVTGTFLDIRSRIRSGGEQGLLSVAFHPAYAQNHRFYVDYTDTNGDTRVVEFKSANGVGPARQRAAAPLRPPAVREPQRRAAPVRQVGLPLRRHGRRRLRRRSGESRAEPQVAPRQAAAHQPDARRLRVADRRLRAAEPVAVLVRPEDRRPLDRRRRPERPGRRSTTARRRGSGSSPTTAGAATRDAPPTTPTSRSCTRATSSRPQWVYSHSDGCSITGGYVYRGSSVPAAAGRYFFGDYCSGTVWSFVAGKGRASAPADMGKIANLSSFGEDGERRALRRQHRRDAPSASLTLASRGKPCFPWPFVCSRRVRFTVARNVRPRRKIHLGACPEAASGAGHLTCPVEPRLVPGT